MGLDMYVYKIRKAELEDREYTAEEFTNLGLSYVNVEDAHDNIGLYAQLLPYTVKRNVSVECYNIEKMIADFNLPSNSHIWMRSYEKIALSGTTDDGRRVEQEIFREDIESKYTITKTNPYYVWKEEEVDYWRKHYDLQDWIYDTLDGVDNTGYYILNADTIKELNKEFNECIPAEDPTDESALFYWEWY